MKKTNIDPEKRRKLAQIFYEMRKKSLSKMRRRRGGFMESVEDDTSFKDCLNDCDDLMTLCDTEVIAGSEWVDL